MNRTVRILYGFPSKELQLDMVQWLAEDETRELMILEERPQPELTLLLKDPRIRFVILEEFIEETFKELAQEFVFAIFEYFPVPGSSEKSHERMQKLFSHMQQIQADIQLRASDYRDLGINILKNVSKNASYFRKSYQGKDLFKVFSQIPAVICGAGPSLAHSANNLQKIENRALIFSGGSALSALHSWNVLPHFAAGIDPDVSLKRFLTHSCFEIPFFYQSRLQQQHLSLLQGPLLWMPPSGGYPLELWLQEEVGMKAELFDGGWNVVTFLAAIAYELGCNPIIFTGCDLSYSGKSPYARGVNVMEIEDVIELKDENDNLVYSRRDWLAAAKWLENFSKSRPEVEWINCTQGGLALSGMKHLSLEKIKFSKQWDLRGNVHAAIQCLKKDAIDFKKPLQEMRDSFESINQICGKLLALIDKNPPDGMLRSAEYLQLVLQLEEEVVYQHFLLPIWNVWKWAFIKEIPEGLPQGLAQDLHKWLFITRICHDAREI